MRTAGIISAHRGDVVEKPDLCDAPVLRPDP